MSNLRPRNTKQLLVSLSTTLIHSLHLKVLKCQERLNTFEVLSANFNTSEFVTAVLQSVADNAEQCWKLTLFSVDCNTL